MTESGILGALRHSRLAVSENDKTVAAAIPAGLAPTVAEWVTLSFAAGQGVLAEDVCSLKRRVGAIEAARSDHAAPLAVDFDELRRTIDRSGR